jgi:transposase-like protein
MTMPTTKIQFDLEKALEALKSGQDLGPQKGHLYRRCCEGCTPEISKLTKTKGGFANENSLLKLPYAGVMSTAEKRTHPVQNWILTLSQMAIHFEVAHASDNFW